MQLRCIDDDGYLIYSEVDSEIVIQFVKVNESNTNFYPQITNNEQGIQTSIWLFDAGFYNVRIFIDGLY